MSACTDCGGPSLPCADCDRPARGWLGAALRGGKLVPPEWAILRWRGLEVSVAADALAGPDPTFGTPLRMPVSYAETIDLYRERNWLPPTIDMCREMYAQAALRPQYIGLVSTTADQQRMATLGFTRRFDKRLRAALAKEPARRIPGAEPLLAFGPWKLWILDHRLSVRGAVNHGFWDRAATPAKPIQLTGTAHDASHLDYSQLAQPIQRWALESKSGRVVDLLDVFAHDVPVRFLDVFRNGEP